MEVHVHVYTCTCTHVDVVSNEILYIKNVNYDKIIIHHE